MSCFYAWSSHTLDSGDGALLAEIDEQAALVRRQGATEERRHPHPLLRVIGQIATLSSDNVLNEMDVTVETKLEQIRLRHSDQRCLGDGLCMGGRKVTGFSHRNRVLQERRKMKNKILTTTQN